MVSNPLLLIPHMICIQEFSIWPLLRLLEVKTDSKSIINSLDLLVVWNRQVWYPTRYTFKNFLFDLHFGLHWGRWRSKTDSMSIINSLDRLAVQAMGYNNCTAVKYRPNVTIWFEIGTIWAKLVRFGPKYHNHIPQKCNWRVYVMSIWTEIVCLK